MTRPATKPLDVDAILRKHATLISPVGQPCAIGKSKSAALVDALFARGLSGPSVMRILEAETGESIGIHSLTRHRRKDCKCPKT